MHVKIIQKTYIRYNNSIKSIPVKNKHEKIKTWKRARSDEKIKTQDRRIKLNEKHKN